jgi:hypothetical protein
MTAFAPRQDATTSAIVVGKGWILEEHLDEDHVVKSREGIFQQNQWLSVPVGVGKTRRKNVLL